MPLYSVDAHTHTHKKCWELHETNRKVLAQGDRDGVTSTRGFILQGEKLDQARGFSDETAELQKAAAFLAETTKLSHVGLHCSVTYLSLDYLTSDLNLY